MNLSIPDYGEKIETGNSQPLIIKFKIQNSKLRVVVLNFSVLNRIHTLLMTERLE